VAGSAGEGHVCTWAGCGRVLSSRSGLVSHLRAHERRAEVEPAPQVSGPYRELGSDGRRLWDVAHESGVRSGSAEALLILCEQVDERVELRRLVAEIGDVKDRAALRVLEEQIGRGLRDLGLTIPVQVAESSVSDWTEDDE